MAPATSDKRSEAKPTFGLPERRAELKIL